MCITCVYRYEFNSVGAKSMATPDFPQERLVHDAFGYVGFLLAEVRRPLPVAQGVFVPFFEGRKEKTQTLRYFFLHLEKQGSFFQVIFPIWG